MTIPRLFCATLAAALSITGAGCAFFTKSEPVVLRYFTPESIAIRPDPGGVEQAMRPTGFDLRLGRINSASYVKDRIAFRDRSFEIGYYDDLRWTEKPEAYLRRALGRALFEEQGVRQIISGAGPTLEVDLDAFEELRAPKHAARMQVSWALHDDELVQERETFTTERIIASSDPAGPGGLAAAMAGAFDDSVKHVAARVMAALEKNVSRAAAPCCAPSARGR